MQNRTAMGVSCCDRIHDLHSKLFQQTQAVFETLIKSLGMIAALLRQGLYTRLQVLFCPCRR